MMVAATVITITTGCGDAPSVSTHDVAAPVPDHYFIPADPGQTESVECRLRADESSWSEIWHRPLPACTLDSGWTALDSSGTWVTSDRAEVTLHLRSTDWDQLIIHAGAYSGLPEDVDQDVVVELNGRSIGTVRLEVLWAKHTVEIPAGLLQVGTNSLSMIFAHRSSPDEAGRGDDRRRLAARVKSIELNRSGFGPSDTQQPGPNQIFDPSTGNFVVDEEGTLVLPWELPDGTTVLDFDLELSSEIGDFRTTILSGLTFLDGGLSPATEFEVDVARGVHRKTYSIPIEPAKTGDTVLLTFDFGAVPDGVQIAMSSLRSSPLSGGKAPALETTPPELDVARQPDIVLITLDAARSGQFSHAGYPRQTTPKIDAFAQEAVVFTEAFALAPYTLCSVPTMITGLSFLDHGVTSRGDVLSGDVVTLAEYLAAAGYRTAAFSTTPNNSSAKGMDQGYQEFFERWKGVDRKTARDPHYLTRRVLQWLDDQDGSQPIHLQIHFIPPHGPYAPAPQFDRFTDPEYAGPCEGRSKTIQDIESGRIPVDTACLENIVALYDGNLLAADDAVGQLLDALRARERWSETVVLITSDHGEAFLEHGRMGHNSTVFDEMLHVPFILRTPAWMDTSRVDPDRLATLADIVPTLLSTASIQPLSPLEGVNLLTNDADTTVNDPRFFVAANTGKPPLMGLRTHRWKLLLYSPGHGALFDLANDPMEEENLRFDNPALFAGLGMLLTRQATAPTTLAPSAQSNEISEEDREMLEALGYVE